ncbi:PAS domain-containing sensor histidine kinase [Bacteroidetes/Chlorobi group bacterium Naka2016]|jgi:signal transduction histidine kinase|nr:MAG: PAS domain-containing sensor histidine kinase [Bacteroidetes/Chlorobi group bacterium Naka2016]
MEVKNLIFYKDIIHRSPIGFAHHKIILDDEGKPIDFLFIDANPAFEKFTGLKIENLLNRTLLEVIPEIKNDKFDWISFYGSIALNGGQRTFLQYSETLKRWYKVTVFSHQKYFFTTFFFDVTEEYSKLLSLKEREEKIEKIAEDTQKLAEDLAIAKSVLEEALYEKNLLLYELTETKEKLEESNREKDKFFSIIAHDLKSPFSGFLGIAEMLSMDIESFSKEELVDIAKMLKESAQNVYKLIENLLEWSRVQRGMIPFQPDKYNLRYIVEQVQSLQKVNIDKKEIDFQNFIPEDCEVVCDENMLSTVFRNLISNAVKFTPRGGKIIVSANVQDNYWVVTVEDSGIGIPKDMLPVLFKVGAKTSRPGTEGESSTGLGLVLCKEYIERHKGKIWVESEEGKGTKFFFTLPTEPNI